MEAKTLGRLASFLDPYLTTLGREERRRHGATYIRGLMLGDSRRTASGIARSSGDDDQALQQFLGHSRWSAKALLDRLALDIQGIAPGRRALVIDDTGFPKCRRSPKSAPVLSGLVIETCTA